DVLVGNLPVATDDVLALCAGKFVQVGLELLEKGVFHRLTVFADCARWGQQGADADVVEVRLQVAAVHVFAAGQPKAEDDGLGGAPGVDGHPVGVGLWRIEKIGEVIRQDKLIPVGKFRLLGAQILQTDDVGILAREPVEQAAVRRLEYSIHGKTDDSHVGTLNSEGV